MLKYVICSTFLNFESWKKLTNWSKKIRVSTVVKEKLNFESKVKIIIFLKKDIRCQSRC